MSLNPRRVHLVVGLLAIVGLPVASWIDGSRQFAWTMFSLTGSYRLNIFEVDAGGARIQLAATELAESAHGPAAAYFSGAESWRYHDVGRVTMDRHLEEVAMLGCRVAAAKGARAPIFVEVRLDERRDLDAPLASRVVRVACGVGG